MKRNQSIELMKFYFAISVALGHYSTALFGSMAVMLFFAMSGYFLVCSFDSGKYADAWQYTMARVKRIYPYYITAFLLLFCMGNLKLLATPKAFLDRVVELLPEVFLLQNVGVFDGGINYPMWQLCSLIVVSHMLFSLLIHNRQLTLNVICPVLALTMCTYYANAFGGPEPEYWYVKGGIFSMTLFRAAGGVAVGMLVHDPMKACLKKLENSASPRTPLLVSLGSVLLLVVVWVSKGSFIVLVPFFALLVCMLYSKGVFARVFCFPFLARLDKLSLGLYLNHAAVIKGIRRIRTLPKLSFLGSDIAFVVILIVYSMIMLAVVDFIISRCRKASGKQAA